MQNTAQSGCFCWGCIHGGSQLSWGAGAGSGGASGAGPGSGPSDWPGAKPGTLVLSRPAASVRPIIGSSDIGSSAGNPVALSGIPGPSPWELSSRCMLTAVAAGLSSGTGPVIGGRSTGTTPVAYDAAQLSTLRA